jgi:hypothetical protein
VKGCATRSNQKSEARSAVGGIDKFKFFDVKEEFEQPYDSEVLIMVEIA